MNNIDTYLKTLYDLSLYEIRDKLNISPIHKYKVPSIKGTLIPIGEIVNYDQKPDVIIGGPCIDHNILTLETAYDISNILLLSKDLNVPSIVYISDIEYQLAGNKLREGFISRLKILVEELSKEIGIKTNIILTSSLLPDQMDKLDAALYENKIDKQELIRLYNFKEREKPPKLNVSLLMLIRKITIYTYLPSTVSKILGIKDPKVLVTENLQQIKAIKIADRIEGNIDVLLTLPFPSTGDKNRMYRATLNHKINICNISGKINKLGKIGTTLYEHHLKNLLTEETINMVCNGG